MPNGNEGSQDRREDQNTGDPRSPELHVRVTELEGQYAEMRRFFESHSEGIEALQARVAVLEREVGIS